MVRRSEGTTPGGEARPGRESCLTGGCDYLEGTESVEEQGMDLQKLGRKAFPAAEGKSFDYLLKGRFYQALHPRWQKN